MSSDKQKDRTKTLAQFPDHISNDYVENFLVHRQRKLFVVFA